MSHSNANDNANVIARSETPRLSLRGEAEAISKPGGAGSAISKDEIPLPNAFGRGMTD